MLVLLACPQLLSGSLFSWALSRGELVQSSSFLSPAQAPLACNLVCSAPPPGCLVGISNFISKLSSLTLPYSPHPPTHTPQTCPFQALATRSEPRGGGCEDVGSRAVGLEPWSDSAAWRPWAVQTRAVLVARQRTENLGVIGLFFWPHTTRPAREQVLLALPSDCIRI